MRIHHIINSYSRRAGGAERLVRSMHLRLLARGIDSRLFGLEAHEDDELEQAQSLGLKSPYSLRALSGLASYLRSETHKEDIVHAHLFPSTLYCSMSRKLLKGPLLVTEHSTNNGRRGTLFGRLADNITYNGCDSVICISQGAESALQEWVPRCLEKTQVIHNGVRLNFSEPPNRDGKDRMLIASVGNLRQAKNYSMALQALAKLGDVNFEYWIAGQGREGPRLKALANELGLAERVRFLGFVDDVPTLLRKADVFLVPSRWEGFGMAAVEAMNAALPVVAADVDGLREVVGTDGRSALLVNPDDPGDIANALRVLVSKPDLRYTLGRSGFQRAAQFSEDAMIEDYLKLYRRLLAAL